MTTKVVKKADTRLRIRLASWFREEIHNFVDGYEIVFPHGIVLVQRIGRGRFFGPEYILPLLGDEDTPEEVLHKLRAWVHEHKEQVVKQLAKQLKEA